MTLPSLKQSMQQLIATPSVSSVRAEHDMSNRPVVDLLAEWFEALGFRIRIQALADGKANLIASAGPQVAEGNAGLVLSGHTDTVPFDTGRWQQDPLRLQERDNRWYGLGATDMKGFFAVVLAALRDMPLQQLQQPLTIVATADEESAMTGAKALVAEGQALGRFALIGEPTELKPIRMHKGIFMEQLRVIGQSGHSSDPSLGANALEGMHRVIAALLTYREQLQSQWRNDGFAVPVPTLNLGHIHGGDNPNRICGACSLSLDLRLMPGMVLEDIRAELRDVAAKALHGSGCKLEVESEFDGVPAIETPADSPLVQATEEHCGCRAGSVAFCTEAPYFQQLGADVVVCGPGSIDQAHQPDEYLSLAQLKPALHLIQSLTQQFCLSR